MMDKKIKDRTDMLKISVIIPVYKVEKYIHQCVDSVLSQTYQNIEVILVDDGSPDRCPEICDYYAHKDRRVVVIHQENGGLSAARNAGVRRASGDYIAFLDSDDYWYDTTAAERLVNRLQITKAEVLSFSYVKCSESGEVISRRFDQIKAMPQEGRDISFQLSYLTDHAVYIASAWNKLTCKRLVLANPFELGKTSEDIEWCARLLRDAESFDFVNEIIYCYRQREGSITHSFTEKNCIDLADNILRCIKLTSEAPEGRQKYLKAYTAYQLGTFFAVQARAMQCPERCMEQLQPHQGLLRFNRGSKKVTLLDYGCRLIGFANMCRLIRLTKKLWHRQGE